MSLLELYKIIVVIIMATAIMHVIFDYKIASVVSFFSVIVYLIISPYWVNLSCFDKTVLILVAFFCATILYDVFKNKILWDDILDLLERLNNYGLFVFFIIFSSVFTLIFIDNITGVNGFLYHYLKLEKYSYIVTDYDKISQQYFEEIKQYSLYLQKKIWYENIAIYIDKEIKPTVREVDNLLVNCTRLNLYEHFDILLPSFILVTFIIFSINFFSFYVAHFFLLNFVGSYILKLNPYAVLTTVIIIWIIIPMMIPLYYFIKFIFSKIKQFFNFIISLLFKK